jgi:hypothetical protein
MKLAAEKASYSYYINIYALRAATPETAKDKWPALSY